MFLEQFFSYIRENQTLCSVAAYGILLLLCLFIFVEAARTRREVHRICKRIKRYFDVITREEEPDAQSEPELEGEEAAQEPEVLMYQPAEEEPEKKARQQLQDQQDAKLLMDVISDIF